MGKWNLFPSFESVPMPLLMNKLIWVVKWHRMCIWSWQCEVLTTASMFRACIYQFNLSDTSNFICNSHFLIQLPCSENLWVGRQYMENLFVCVFHVCVYLCICVCVCIMQFICDWTRVSEVCSSGCAYVEARGWRYISTCFWQSLSFYLELFISVRFPDQKALRSHLSLPSQSWAYRHVPSCPDFSWLLGVGFGSSCLCNTSPTEPYT